MRARMMLPVRLCSSTVEVVTTALTVTPRGNIVTFSTTYFVGIFTATSACPASLTAA